MVPTMTGAEALHTAARRYCLERAAYWRTRYAELAPHQYQPDYHEEERAVFSRYNALDAVLVEVERLRPDEFATLGEAREWLVLAGDTAQSAFTKPSNGQIEERVMREERDLFRDFILRLDAAVLSQVRPLPYRHALTKDEGDRLWARANARWKVGDEHYWYPLEGDPPDAVAFAASPFHANVPLNTLRGILAARGVGRVFELREWGPEYELDLSLFEPRYNGAEGYWTEGEMEWLIYASHEDTVTVVGVTLVQAITESWPTWAEHHLRW